MKPKAVAESPVQVSIARSTRHAGVPPLREFERCVLVLERELCLDPSPATRDLYHAVLDARPAVELVSLLGIKTAHLSQEQQIGNR